MAALKVHGMAFSTCTRRILTLLEELQVPYELVVVDITKGESTRPDYLKWQPFGKIPVLEDQDEGVLLFESRAVVRYLVTKYADKAGALAGKDAKSRAVIDNWVEAEAQEFHTPASLIVVEKVFKPWRGLSTDEDNVAKLLPQIEGVLDVYEKVLAQRPYLAGNECTIADLSHLPYFSLLVTAAGHSDVLNNRPHVRAWWDRITSRPSWQKVSQMQ